jgi:hypothetical protein
MCLKFLLEERNRFMHTPGHKPVLVIYFAISLSLLTSGCTGQIPGSFRFLQQDQTFQTSQDVNTKIDLLWVVDNSSSMDVHQKKLRDGFLSFTTKYLKPTWDIRVAVITTDTYLANSAFSNYYGSQIPNTNGYTSSYLSGLPWLADFRNPTSDPSLVNTSTGTFSHGIKYGDLNPLWGPLYALLQPGIHDGPITAFCFEGMPYFLKGVTLCNLRDTPNLYSGPSKCINPDTSAGESSLSQCINTVQNDTVRSGKAIISTVPPLGVAGDSAWINQLRNDFIINASVGSSGSGSERGLSSVLQLISDNEKTSHSFFRPNSLRGIIFLTDEDDQSLEIPSLVSNDYNPHVGYKCDQTSLLANNGNSTLVHGTNGLCCNGNGNSCKYGSLGISCPTKTVDGFSYKLGICADSTQLIPVSNIKQELDQFFTTLDSNGTSDPNYFIVTITPTSGASIQAIQSSRNSIDAVVGTLRVHEADRGDRYIQLGDLVGGGSLTLDINSSDYSPVLDSIGREIVQKKSKFTLSRAPTSKEEMIVKILHQNGTSDIVPSHLYTISGKILTFIDEDFVLSLTLNDKVSINYQPQTAY